LFKIGINRSTKSKLKIFEEAFSQAFQHIGRITDAFLNEYSTEEKIMHMATAL
jgi:hypothetical protein